MAVGKSDLRNEDLSDLNAAEDDETIVLHWNEAARTWDLIPWSAFVKFRAFLEKFQPLPGIGAGDHWFVVCIVDEQKTLFNIIPHRYRLDLDGCITDHHFHDLSAEEIDKVSKWEISRVTLEDADQSAFNALRDRMWRSYLPTPEAAMVLMRQLPGFPASGAHRPVLSFLKAFGFTPQNQSVN
jgi:hypothetical protein